MDSESGLYNYGYRFYHPHLGRWLSRDPIEEDGGLNFFTFVENESIKQIDLFGLYKSYDEAAEACGAKAKILAVEDQKKRQGKFKLVPQEYEYGGRVCKSCDPNKKDDAYYCTEPVRGEVNGINPNYTAACTPPDDYAGFYHSHPGNNSPLSPEDRTNAREGFGPLIDQRDPKTTDTRDETQRKPVTATSGNGKYDENGKPTGFHHDRFPKLSPPQK